MNSTGLSCFNTSMRPQLPEHIVVYDSTLRDGEQMAGVRFSQEQKLTVATKLDEIGVHQIEAGFPAVSQVELDSVRAISQLGLEADVLCLARTLEDDIDAVLKCDVDMVLLFIATSELHMRYKLKMTSEEVLERAVRATEYAMSHGLTVSMSTEDSTRSDIQLMLELYRRCEESGATRIGITDTIGCAAPWAISHIVSKVADHTDLPVSAHLHNDFGLALPNALAALTSGAQAVATTVGGIGERAGNVPLEQLVMVLKTLCGRDIGISTEGLTDLVRTVYGFAGLSMPANQPWTGSNAFSHESGIHVAAVLNCPLTYECVPPESVGNRRRLVLGKHSGTAIVKSRLEERGITPSQERICDIVREIKRLGERQGRVSDDQFWRVVEEIMSPPDNRRPCSEDERE
ncbi:MAG: homoaconitate hydratase [Methanobacteriota archaeon]|nr:MAG: homoaconitate hydratase [Euryarchaeota archaeon]